MKRRKKSLITYAPKKWVLYHQQSGNMTTQHSWLSCLKSPLHPIKVRITIEELSAKEPKNKST